MSNLIALNLTRSSQIIDILQLVIMYEEDQANNTKEFKYRYGSLEIFISNVYDHLGEFVNYLNSSEHLREKAAAVLQWYLSGDSDDFLRQMIDDELLKPMSLRIEPRAMILMNSLYKKVHSPIVFKRIRLSASQRTRAMRLLQASMTWERNPPINAKFSKLNYISEILATGILPKKAAELLSSNDELFILPETQACDILDWYIERSPKGVYQGVVDTALKSGILSDSDIIRISKIPDFYYEETRQPIQPQTLDKTFTDIWECQENSKIRADRLKVIGNKFYRPIFTAAGKGIIEEWTMVLNDPEGINHNIFSNGVHPNITVKQFGWKSFTFNDSIGDLFICKRDAQLILLARMEMNLAEVKNSIPLKG